MDVYESRWEGLVGGPLRIMGLSCDSAKIDVRRDFLNAPLIWMTIADKTDWIYQIPLLPHEVMTQPVIYSLSTARLVWDTDPTVLTYGPLTISWQADT